MSSVDATIAELQIVVDRMKPQLEGLQDYGRMLTGDAEGLAKQAVSNVATTQNSNLSKINTLLVGLKELVSNGYPFISEYNVPPEVLAVLKANKATVDAALGIFTSPSEAVDADVTLGVPTPR